MGKPRMDLTGQKYGRLTVLREVDGPPGNRFWLCQCDCGSDPVTVRMNKLRTGNTKSCGCYQREKASTTNSAKLEGKRFGKLTVIARAGSGKQGVLWNCACDCGDTTIVPSEFLQRGLTKSCGCYRAEQMREMRKVTDVTHRVDDVMVPTLKRKKNKNNTSGHKGVSVTGGVNKRYRVSINVKNQSIYIGTFPTLDQAVKERQKAEEKYHKPYLDKYNTRKCESCGESFTPSQKTARFCSPRCRYRDNARRKRLIRSDDGRCPQCGGEWIEPVQTGKKKPKHCRKCQDYYKSRREHKSNE